MTNADLSKVKSQIVLRWATRADIPDITRILVANLLEFELHDHFVPERKQYPAEYHEFLLRRVKLFFIKAETRYMVAEASIPDADGVQQTAIVGFSTWEAQGSNNQLGQQWQKARTGWAGQLETFLIRLELNYYRYFLNRIVDYEALDEVMKRLHAAYESLDWLQNCLHLQFLMVDPAWHRGFGVGRKLLQWGTEVSDQLRLPIVLESSLVAYDFYLKHGFRLLEHVHIDVVPDKAYDVPIVVYEPEKQPK
ncbi:Putative GNAT domain, acyl-CoA N-acyltransferase [Septoria linicola]|uniref:GNAT domain, acyl-CoA N-acyltransferase n=1 Tax=Septoria linicola TaxID=215465 RepID=A0A9Q9EHN4_9PEZI|nr:putative GNAT domain, acyl-CoA N-acyltransferase [Septoria linicola]USW50204.1 Putative GNAT domain, acyl-CoA N-acyltransferase [Septoria linicola]